MKKQIDYKLKLNDSETKIMLENNKLSLLVKKFDAKYNVFVIDQNINDSETKIMLENNKLSLLVEELCLV